MNNKNVKVVDEHSIDRDAIVMFALDLEGSEYVVYWIERDEDNGNIFVSKVIKNLDGTFNMLNIDDSMEKSKLSDIVKTLITTAVNSNDDKLNDSSFTLPDGKIAKFITVLFNKEQRINVQRTYITTVKKEVIRVTEKYYVIEDKKEEEKLFEDIFPTLSTTPAKTEDNVSELNVFSPTGDTLSEKTTVVSNDSAIKGFDNTKLDNFVTFGSETTIPKDTMETSVVSVPTSENIINNKEELDNISAPIPSVVEPITVGDVISDAGVASLNVLPSSTSSAVMEQPSSNVTSSLVFDAAKETNLNAALGEVASSTSIPVENIDPVREFGVDETPKTESSVNPSEHKVVQSVDTVDSKAGFANSKFFMVVAVAFFLASCIFLGYEVFNYFQLTK